MVDAGDLKSPSLRSAGSSPASGTSFDGLKQFLMLKELNCSNNLTRGFFMEANLKVYTCDFGWMGSIVVIARTKEAAHKLMEGHENYDCKVVCGVKPELKEFALEAGFVHCDYGDT